MERIHEDCGNLWNLLSARSAGGLFEGSECGGQGVKNTGAEAHVVELAFVTNGDEAGGFEFLDVVRKRGGGDSHGGQGLRAAQRA